MFYVLSSIESVYFCYSFCTCVKLYLRSVQYVYVYSCASSCKQPVRTSACAASNAYYRLYYCVW